MAKSDELVKYITQRVVTYIDTPKPERQERPVVVKEHWMIRWFGVVPFGVQIWLNGRRNKNNETPPTS